MNANVTSDEPTNPSEQGGLEDRERRDELIAYFDLAWEIFTRLEKERKVGISSLTISEVNHTVKPLNPLQQDQSTEST